jgi:chemotaxis family two-component system response regulator Rcp1
MMLSSAVKISTYEQPYLFIIDDNEGDIELARIAFEEAGTRYRIKYLRSAADAIAELKAAELGKTCPPDMILLDLNMPGIHGKEFLEIIKASDRHKMIPILLLTSSEATHDIQDCFRLHASGYIIKPSTAAERMAMVDKVKQFMGRD